MQQPGIESIAAAFAIPGRFVSAAPLGSGHIHATHLVVHEDAGRRRRTVLQRLNRAVFPEPAKLMENVARVTGHQQALLARENVPDAARRALRLVPPRAGGLAHVDASGETWRAFVFVEGAHSHDVVRGAADARAAAQAFGRFQTQLVDLPEPPLHEVLPRFHDARWRLEQLLEAARADACGRLRDVRAEMDFVLAREGVVDRLPALRSAGRLPERIAHNDTKINNVLFDDASGEAICVIDLDTVMPGLAVHDFGDLVRTAASPTAEDERDLTKVGLREDLFAALVEGYLRGARAFLTEVERAELGFASRLLTLTVGMRFLADHLAGDRYFRVHRPGQNLDRARTQLRLVASIEEHSGRMEEIVAEAAERLRSER